MLKKLLKRDITLRNLMRKKAAKGVINTLSNPHQMDIAISIRLNQVWVESRGLKKSIKNGSKTLNKIESKLREIYGYLLKMKMIVNRSILFKTVDPKNDKLKFINTVFENIKYIDKYTYEFDIKLNNQRFNTAKSDVKSYSHLLDVAREEYRKTDFLRKFFRKEKFWLENKDRVLNIVEDKLANLNLTDYDKELLFHIKNSIINSNSFKEFRENFSNVKGKTSLVVFFNNVIGLTE